MQSLDLQECGWRSRERTGGGQWLFCCVRCYYTVSDLPLVLPIIVFRGIYQLYPSAERVPIDKILCSNTLQSSIAVIATAIFDAAEATRSWPLAETLVYFLPSISHGVTCLAQ